MKRGSLTFCWLVFLFVCFILSERCNKDGCLSRSVPKPPVMTTCHSSLFCALYIYTRPGFFFTVFLSKLITHFVCAIPATNDKIKKMNILRNRVKSKHENSTEVKHASRRTSDRTCCQWCRECGYSKASECGYFPRVAGCLARKRHKTKMLQCCVYVWLGQKIRLFKARMAGV